MRVILLVVVLFISSDVIAESNYPEYSIPKTCMGYVVADKRIIEDGLVLNGMSPGLCSQIIIKANTKDAVLDHCLTGRACAISGTLIVKPVGRRAAAILDSVSAVTAIPSIGVDHYPSLVGRTCRGRLYAVGEGYYYLNGDGGACLGVEIWPTSNPYILARCREGAVCAISGDIVRYSSGAAFWSRIQNVVLLE